MDRNRSIRVAALGLALVSTLGAVACAGGRADGPSGFGSSRGSSARSEAPVLLTVDNQDFRDATIYSDWNGIIQRVGTVIGKTSETLTMPWRDYQVRFRVDFLGGGDDMLTPPIAVGPGEHIDFVIPPGW